MNQKKIIALCISTLFIGLVQLPMTTAFDATVTDFNRIWYQSSSGFNKVGDGTLVLALTYTNNSLRTIDECSITFQQDPFYFSITFQDTLKRDTEGNSIEPKDGYFYLRKDFPKDARMLASKNLPYTTITYNGDIWYRLHVPSFNQQYEWGTYTDPEIGESWYTWGNKETIRFQQRAMFIQKIKETMGTLEFDITHSTDTSGQQISINKEYLKNKGITHPVFELNKKRSLSYTMNETHYLIHPPHFSYLSLHQASSGTVNGSIPLQLQTSLDGENGIRDIWANESYVVATQQEEGMRLYQNTVGSLTLLDTQDDGGYYTSVYGNNTTVFTACGFDGLRAYSITGGSISLVDTIDNGGYYTSVWCNENYVYCASKRYLRAYSFSGGILTLLNETSHPYSDYSKVTGNSSYLFTVYDNTLNAYSFDGTDFTLHDSRSDCDSSIYYAINCNETHIFTTDGDVGLRCYQFNGTNLNLIAESLSLDYSIYSYNDASGKDGYVYMRHGADGLVIYYISGSNIIVKDRHYKGSIYLSGFTYNETSYVGTFSQGILAYNLFEEFNVTRTVGASTETNNFTFTPIHNITVNGSCVILCCPVSNDNRGIVDVTNNTCGTQANSVSSYSSLTNNTYWYDSANKNVYIGTINLSTSSVVNWTVNCSYGANFSIHIPTYLTVGDYLTMNGMIENSTDSPISGLIANTYVFYENGTIAIGDNPEIKWNCTNGNYETSISTTVLIPGVYSVVINFTDPDTGITFNYGKTLYLSYETPTGVYYDSTVIIRWYNTNLGLGLPDETLQLYIDEVLQKNLDYETYAGNNINVTVKDYYNNTLNQNDFTINKNPYPIRLGLTFHEYDFTNMNEEYSVIGFLRENASRWFEQVVPSRGHEEFLMPTGNYTIRVYNADNSTYTSWNETVNNSKGYTIDGNTITQVIQGLSVVTGDILELQNDLSDAVQPDFIRIVENPPTIYSVFERKGMILDTCQYLCPELIVQAETRNTSYNHDFISYPLIPTNDTSENGTISIVEDTLYLSGNATYVNITYTNGTTLQNTTYVPGVVDLYGGDVWINASRNVFVRRETIYQQNKQFEWMYWASSGHGPLPNRKGYHEHSFNISNVLNTTLYNVYVIAGLSNETSCDASTMRVRDAANSNTELEQGNGYDVTDSAIHFRVQGSIPADTDRVFPVDYYESTSDSYKYTNVKTTVNQYRDGELNGEPYKYFDVDYTNQESKTLRGELYVKIGFSVPTEINTATVKIRDEDNNQLLNDSLFIPTQSYVLISHDALGDVLPGSTRDFRVFFKLKTYPGMEKTEMTLTTPIPYLFGLTWQMIITLIGLGILGFGGYKWILVYKGSLSKVHSRKYAVVFMIGLGIIFFTFLFASIGM